MHTLTEPPLWTAARAMLDRMRRAIGEATALADRAWIGPREQRDIRAWLSPLIAMVRKLVLIEAIALLRLADPPARPNSDRARGRQSISPPPCGAGRGAAAANAQNDRVYSLRLWPKFKRSGPRVRQLGPPVLVRDIWRDRARAAAARHLQKVRFMRPPPGVQFARRIEALARILERPLAAARRLARKLRDNVRLALKLIARKLPRSRRYQSDAYRRTGERAFDDAVGLLYPNTS